MNGMCLCVFLAPKGTNVTAKVTEVGDGLYNVEYTPTDIGSFRDLCNYRQGRFKGGPGGRGPPVKILPPPVASQ